MDGYNSFLALLGRFVVRISGANVRGGTGFFIAPGEIITCAHVVSQGGPLQGATAERVHVSWTGGGCTGVVTAQPPAYRRAGLWPYPDLAVIVLSEPVPDPMWIPLGDTMPTIGDRLYASGYSSVYEKGTLRLGGSTVEYEFPQGFDNHEVLKVKGGELAAGMSGGPLLAPEAGHVSAVVTTTRREGLPHGGLAVPASAVRACFPEAWERNQRPQPHTSAWPRLLSALRHNSAHRSLLSASEQRALEAAATGLGLDPTVLYWRAVGDLGPAPDAPLEDFEAVLRECADAQPAQPGAVHPLVRLIELLVAEVPAGAVAHHLADLVGRLAARLGQPYSSPGEPPPAHVPDQRISAIEVRLTPAGANRRRYLLSIWKYPDIKELPVPVLCADTPMTLLQAREQVKTVLPGTVWSLRDHADDLVVEFAVPGSMLHKTGVDEWDLGMSFAPLGTLFMVVLRALDRAPESYGHWVRRWRRLHSKVTSEARPTVDWVDCRNEDTIDKLFASFQQAESLAVLAVSHQPDSGAGKHALQAALYAGVPAAIWPRVPCPEHAKASTARTGEAWRAPGPVSNAGNGSPCAPTVCTGDRFLTAVAKQLADTPLSDLPRLVHRLRIEARAQEQDVEHCGRGLTLLWDDPTRRSPEDGIALVAPVPAR